MKEISTQSNIHANSFQTKKEYICFNIAFMGLCNQPLCMRRVPTRICSGSYTSLPLCSRAVTRAPLVYRSLNQRYLSSIKLYSFSIMSAAVITLQLGGKSTEEVALLSCQSVYASTILDISCFESE